MPTPSDPATLSLPTPAFSPAEVSRVVAALARPNAPVLSVGLTMSHPTYQIDSVALESAASAGLNCSSNDYGLALVVPSGDFAKGLDSYEAVVGLANVLAELRDSAAVVWLGDCDPTATFVAFGLAVTTVSTAEPVGFIGRLLGRRPSGREVVVGQLAGKPLTKLQYHAIARDLVMASMRAAA